MKPSALQQQQYIANNLGFYSSPEVKVLTGGYVVTFKPSKGALKANSSLQDLTFACGSDRQVKHLFSLWLTLAKGLVGE